MTDKLDFEDQSEFNQYLVDKMQDMLLELKVLKAYALASDAVHAEGDPDRLEEHKEKIWDQARAVAEVAAPGRERDFLDRMKTYCGEYTPVENVVAFQNPTDREN